jgi:hypothetical protein
MMLFRKKNPDAPREPAFYEVPWIRALISFCVILLVISALIEAYRRADQYASGVVKKEFDDAGPGKAKITLTAKLMNKPAWLDQAILNQIFAETQTFAARDQATYDRLLNPLDHDVLQEIAANYTGTDAEGVNHWTLRDNAWIQRISEVRRVISQDRKSETIEVYADYRQPAAWVAYKDKFYLIDEEAVRLPGEYSESDRKATAGLMAISGVQLPDGMTTVPQPSEKWSGDDVAAGMKLADYLRGQSFDSQVASIDMTNFRERVDKNAPWIVLDTIWTAADGKPRIIDWGRPVGEESFYEVKAIVKLKALNAIYLRFSRIDADRDYVDIRADEVLLPKPPAPPEVTPPA